MTNWGRSDTPWALKCRPMMKTWRRLPATSTSRCCRWSRHWHTTAPTFRAPAGCAGEASQHRGGRRPVHPAIGTFVRYRIRYAGRAGKATGGNAGPDHQYHGRGNTWGHRLGGAHRRPHRPQADPHGGIPSNWELSTARALAIVQFMIEQGVAPERLAATGFGEFHPLDPAPTPEAYARTGELKSS